MENKDRDGYSYYQIITSSGIIDTTEDKNGTTVSEVVINENDLVSMNMFGFPYEFLSELETRFIDFLKANNENIKSEFLLPQVVNDLIKEGKGTVKVLPVTDKWYGMTYASDKEYVKKALSNIKI